MYESILAKGYIQNGLEKVFDIITKIKMIVPWT